MSFLASLSGKNIIFSLDTGKMLSILRCCPALKIKILLVPVN